MFSQFLFLPLLWHIWANDSFWKHEQWGFFFLFFYGAIERWKLINFNHTLRLVELIKINLISNRFFFLYFYWNFLTIINHSKWFCRLLLCSSYGKLIISFFLYYYYYCFSLVVFAVNWCSNAASESFHFPYQISG